MHSKSKAIVTDSGIDRKDPVPVNPDKKPADESGSKFPIWVIILLVVIAVGVLLALGTVMFVKYRNRKLAENLE